MNKKNITILIFIAIIIVIFTAWGRNSIQPVTSEVKPLEKTIPTPTPRPKTFQFDGSTDLKAELEKVDPKVLDSDL